MISRYIYVHIYEFISKRYLLHLKIAFEMKLKLFKQIGEKLKQCMFPLIHLKQH